MGSSSRQRVLKVMGKVARQREQQAAKVGLRKPPVRPCYNLLLQAQAMASERNLLVKDDYTLEPTWYIYDRGSGRLLLVYLPMKRQWISQGGIGLTRNLQGAINMAASQRS